MEYVSSDPENNKSLEQIEQNKKRTTCSNCLYKKTCMLVHYILAMPVDKFVLPLKQVPFYEGINKAMAENCFHFENENLLLKSHAVKQIKEPACKKCNDQYWLYDDNGQRIGGCECHI